MNIFSNFCNLILNGLENELGGGWEGHKLLRRQEGTLSSLCSCKCETLGNSWRNYGARVSHVLKNWSPRFQ